MSNLTFGLMWKKNMRPLIFLDFDGVINTPKTQGAWALNPGDSPFEQELVNRVKYLVKESEAEVVISSTWRMVKEINPDWLAVNIGTWLKDALHKDWYTPKYGGFRGNQINDWLRDHDYDGLFICIDDSSDFYDYQNLIHINCEVGIQEQDVEKALNVLKSQGPEQVLDT